MDKKQLESLKHTVHLGVDEWLKIVVEGKTTKRTLLGSWTILGEGIIRDLDIK